MPSFTFEGFVTGDEVDLSASKGVETVSGNVATWGQAGSGAAEIDIASSEAIIGDVVTVVQYDSARFVPTGWAHFDTAESHAGSGNLHKPRLHDIVYFWDTGKTGDFSTPVNLIPAHKSRRYAHGPVINVVYDTPGSYALRLYAYEPSSGKYSSKTITVMVTSADDAYPGAQTICVNPNGDSDFSGAPAGAQTLELAAGNVFDETLAIWTSNLGGAQKRFLFKGGASFDFSVAMARGDMASGLMFGSYGGGMAVFNSVSDSFPTGWKGETLYRVLINNIDFEGGWVTGSSGGAVGLLQMAGGTHLVMHNCRINGFRGVPLNLTESASDPEHYCYFHLDEVTLGPDLEGQYPLLTDDFTAADTSFAATGCLFYRHPQSDYDDTNARAVARLNGHDWCYLQACDFFMPGNASETQPPLKLGERGDTAGGVYSVHCNTIECGAGPAILFKHNASGGVHTNLICRQNIMTCMSTSGPTPIVLQKAQGTSIDANLLIGLGTASAAPGETRVGVWYDPDGDPGGRSPNRLRNNTFVHYKDVAENFSDKFDAFLDGSVTSDWAIKEGSNILHKIGLGSTPDAPLEDGPVGAALFALRCTGRFTGGTFDTGFAATPGEAYAFRPEGGSAALGDAYSEFYPFPIDAQTEADIRPTGSEDRGCWQTLASVVSSAGAPGSGTLYSNDLTEWQSNHALAPTIPYPSTNTGDYNTVIEGVTFTSLQNVEVGSTVDGKTITNNTIFKNCVFDGMSGNGMDIRNIDGLTVVGCVFRNIGGTGLRMRSSGSTSNVFIWDCDFFNIGENGISSAKRQADGVDHIDVHVVGNRLENMVTSADSKDHCVYLQATAAVCMFNHINGDRPGNGISWRCSGFIGHNSIAIDNADNYTACIKYYPDHLAGPLPVGATDDTLFIFANDLDGTNNALNGVAIGYTSSQGSFSDAEWYVNEVRIADNVYARMAGSDENIASNYDGKGYIDIFVEGVKQN